MTTRYCVAQSVRGAVERWSSRQWSDACDWIKKDDGSNFNGEELEHVFHQMLEEGTELIPFGKCDNFDPKTGCKGHPIL